MERVGESWELTFQSRNKRKTDSLKILVEHPAFEAFIYAIIILDCLFLAVVQEGKVVPDYIVICHWIINVIFILEMGLKMSSKNIYFYFMDHWNWIDACVAGLSVYEIIIKVLFIQRLTNLTPDFVQTFAAVRLFRFIRILFILPQTQQAHQLASSFLKSGWDILCVLSILFVLLISWSIISYQVINDKLNYRCIPVTITDVSELTTFYMNNYNTPYFFPIYNEFFCGEGGNKCDSGSICMNLSPILKPTYWSYSTPLYAFITNFIIMTMRGWTDLFSIIRGTGGYIKAYIFILSPVIFVSIFIVNFFPAVIFMWLKIVQDVIHKRRWRELFSEMDSTLNEFQITVLSFHKYVSDMRQELLKNKIKEEHDDEYGNIDGNENRHSVKMNDTNISLFVRKIQKWKRHCQPQCRPCDKLREIIFAENSVNNILVNILIIVDIILLASNSAYSSDITKWYITQTLLAINSIFIIELFIKMMLLGIVGYFMSPRERIEFCIVFLSIIGTLSSKFVFFSSFRVFRLLYFTNWISNLDMMKSKQINIKFHVFKEIMYKMFSSVVLFIMLLCVLSIIFTLVGMHIFGANGLEFKTIFLYSQSQVTSGLQIQRFVFESFDDAYMSVLLIFTLDAWYYSLWTQIDSSNKYSVIYYILWLSLSNWILQNFLLSCTMLLMDRQATDSITSAAISYELITNRLIKIHHKCQLRHYFDLFRKNIFDPHALRFKLGINTTYENKSVERESNDINIIDNAAYKLFDSSYPLYLVKPGSLFHKACAILPSNPWYIFLINSCAVYIFIITILQIEYSSNVINSNVFQSMNLFLLTLFLFDMLAKWCSRGLFIRNPYGYFYYLLHWIDFISNILLIAYFITGIRLLYCIQVIRIIRIPMTVFHLRRSQSMHELVRAITGSLRSLIGVMILWLLFIFIYAIIGLQIFGGTFGYCSDSNYPPGRHRYTTSDNYPNGCDSLDNSLKWIQPLDRFDDIGKSMQSVIRVFMFNQWHPIMFSAMDSSGLDREPQAYYTKASIIYFLAIVITSIYINTLVVGVIYYHFKVAYLWRERIVIRTVSEAMWIIYQEQLRTVRLLDETSKHARIGWFSEIISSLQDSVIYQLLWVILCLLPIPIWLVSIDTEFLHRTALIPTTIALNCLYSSDFSLRLFFLVGRKKRSKVTFFETFCLIGQTATTILLCQNNLAPTMSNIYIAQIAFVLRLPRFLVMFRVYDHLVETMAYCITGFLPLLVTAGIMIMIYCIIGVELLQLENLTSCWITLLGASTGNGWSEIIDKHTSNLPTQYTFIVYFFFLSFFILFNIILRTFAVVTIYKFYLHSGVVSSIAKQQINNFQSEWRKWRDIADPSVITFHKLLHLLRYINYPLGFDGRPVSHVDVTRLAKRVLLCMEPVKRRRIGEKSNLFTWETLATNITKLRDETFTFTQVLLAVHKQAILSPVLPDEVVEQTRRQIAKERLARLRCMLLYIRTASTSENMSLTLMFQLADTEVYQKTIQKLLFNQISALIARCYSTGFTAFEAFVLRTLQKTVKVEIRTSLQRKIIADKLQELRMDAMSKRRSDLCKANHETLIRLEAALGYLADANTTKYWAVESMEICASIQEKGDAVSAIAIDSNSTLFVAFASGNLKIWKRITDYNSTESPEGMSKFQLFQEIQLGLIIRSLSVRADGVRLVAASGRSAILIAFTTMRTRHHIKSTYCISWKRDHISEINCVVLLDQGCFAGYANGDILQWEEADLPVRTTNAGSNVFCICRLSLNEHAYLRQQISSSTSFCQDLIVCGLNSGQLLILPYDDNRGYNLPWTGKFQKAGDSGISALKMSWNYLYSGSTSGTVRVWAITGISSGIMDVALINLVCISSESVHVGPVTSFGVAVGFIFSASHDLSVIAWSAPHTESAKTAEDFKHSFSKGLVCHQNPIISMDCNPSYIVSGDDAGRVIVRRPTKRNLSMKVTRRGLYREPKVIFSFLKYDFHDCFISRGSSSLKAEAILSIRNITDRPILIRSLYTNNINLNVILDNSFEKCANTKVVYDDVNNAQISPLIQISSGGNAFFRIIFSPTERRLYKMDVSFLVDDEQITKVLIRGHGVHAKLIVEGHNSEIQFGTVVVGTVVSKMVQIKNITSKSMMVQCLGEIECNPESNSLRDKLSERNISIIPRCKYLKAKETMTVEIKFSPKLVDSEDEEINPIKSTVFVSPIKFSFAGQERILFTLNGRVGEIETHNKNVGRARGRSLYPLWGSRSSNLGSPKKLMSPRKSNFLSPLPLATTCPPELTSLGLKMLGWNLGYKGGDAVLFKPSTDVFFEISCQAFGDRESESVISSEYMKPKSDNMLHISLRCTISNHFEIMIGDELYMSDEIPPENVGKTIRIKIPSIAFNNTTRDIVGIISVKIFLYERLSQTQINLVSVSYVKVLKGYRLEMNGMTTRSVTLQDRLIVVGIEKVVSQLQLNLGDKDSLGGVGEKDKLFLGEIVQDFTRSEKVSSYALPTPTVTVTLQNVETDMAYFLVGDWIKDRESNVQPDPKYMQLQEGLKRQATNRLRRFGNLIAQENGRLKKGECCVVHFEKTMRLRKETGLRIREITISLGRLPFQDDSKFDWSSNLTQFQLLKTSGLLKRCNQISRDKMHSLLPHKLISDSFEISVKVPLPKNSIFMQKRIARDSLLESVRSDFGETSMMQNALKFSGRGWVFVLDHSKVKLVSGKHPNPAFTEHPPFEEQATVISFNTRGLELNMKDLSMSIDGGQVIRTDINLEQVADMDYPQISNGYINSIFEIHPMVHNYVTPVPMFLKNAWRLLCMTELLIAAREALLSPFSFSNKYVMINNGQITFHKKIRIGLQKYINTPERQAITARFIYLINKSAPDKENDFTLTLAIINLDISCLREYFLTTQLIGFSKLSEEQVAALLTTFHVSSSSTEFLSIDAFHYWFEINSKSDMRDTLDSSVVIDGLLQEELQPNGKFLQDAKTEIQERNIDKKSYDNVSISSDSCNSIVDSDDEDEDDDDYEDEVEDEDDHDEFRRKKTIIPRVLQDSNVQSLLELRSPITVDTKKERDDIIIAALNEDIDLSHSDISIKENLGNSSPLHLDIQSSSNIHSIYSNHDYKQNGSKQELDSLRFKNIIKSDSDDSYSDDMDDDAFLNTGNNNTISLNDKIYMSQRTSTSVSDEISDEDDEEDRDEEKEEDNSQIDDMSSNSNSLNFDVLCRSRNTSYFEVINPNI